MPKNQKKTAEPSKIYRNTISRFYDTETEKYLPAYPLVWTPSPEIEKAFAKHYDVIIIEYADALDLLGLLHIALYNFLQTYARLDRALIIEPFAAKYKIGQERLISCIDRLQNCELLDRVGRPEHRGRPIDLVLRPPMPKSALYDSGGADRLRDNVKIEKIQIIRQELGKKFPGDDSSFSERQITRSLGNKVYFAREFHEFCIGKTYKLLTQYAKATPTERKDMFLRDVHYFCEKRDINYTPAVVDSALSIAQHYGRFPSTFH